MPLEIDMLSVGNADAIVVHATDLYTEFVAVIDAGNTPHGEKVVDHINRWTTKKSIDLIISTHPDADHLNGLVTVIEQFPGRIGSVLIHNPFAHNGKSFVKAYQHYQSRALEEAFKSLQGAADFIALLDRKGIRHHEPFAGLRYTLPDNMTLTIVGPSQDYYAQLLSSMDVSVLQSVVEQAMMDTWVKGKRSVGETTDKSASNNSSVITMIAHESKKFLFTADAGPLAFESACGIYSEAMRNVYWLQVPHHGSSANLTPGLIEHFRPKVAYVSAAGGDDDNHPSREVVEAINEVGCDVYGTNKSGNLWHHTDTSLVRDGYTTAIPLKIPDDF